MQRHFLLLVAMISWSIVLALNGSQLQAPSKVCIPYIKLGPGIQMELVRNGSQVSSLLGQAGMEPGDSNRQIMREQQYLDFIFIPLYWAFFYYAIGGAFRNTGGVGFSLAKWLRIVISIAAVADYLEDVAILWALRPSYNGPVWPFPFGFTKWLFFFLTVGFSAVLFLRYPKFGSFPTGSRWAGWVGFLFLGSALCGILGTFSVVLPQECLLPVSVDLLIVGLLLLLLWFWKGLKTQRSSPAGAA